MAGRKLDELYWDLRANTDALKADVKKALREIAGLKRSVEGPDGPVQAFERMGEAGAQAARKLAASAKESRTAGEKMGQEIIEGARRALTERLASIQEAFSKGLISEEEFNRQGQEAAQAFNDGLRAARAELDQLGILTPQLEGQLQRALKADAQGALQALETEFQATIGRARLRLADGLIDEDEFEREGREAAEKFNRGIRREIKRLRREGRLTEGEFSRLANSMKRVGDEGEKAGKRSLLSFRNLRFAVASVVAFIAGSRIVRFFRDSASAAIELGQSYLKLEAGAKLFGVAQEDLNELAREAKENFRLNISEANNLAVQTAKLAARAQESARSQELLAAALDLGAAQGLSAAEVAVSLQQALQGLDEGTDKLLQRNPSQIYKEYAEGAGLAATQLTDTQQKQALLNAIIEEGTKVVGAYDDFLQSDIGTLSVWERALRGAREEVGNALLPVLADLTRTLRGPLRTGVEILTRALEGLDRLVSGPLDRLADRLREVADESTEAAQRLLELEEFRLRQQLREERRRQEPRLIVPVELEPEVAGLGDQIRREVGGPTGSRTVVEVDLSVVGTEDVRATLNELQNRAQELERQATDAIAEANELSAQGAENAARQAELEAEVLQRRADLLNDAAARASQILGTRDETLQTERDLQKVLEQQQAIEEGRFRALSAEELEGVSSLQLLVEERRRVVAELDRVREEEPENLQAINNLRERALQIEERIRDVAKQGAAEPTGFSEEEIKAARERLGELGDQLEELQRSGAQFVLLEDAPEPLRAAVNEAIQLRNEIQALERDIVVAGGASEAQLDALARKREQLAEARARAADIADSPEGRIEAGALEARRRVEELIRSRERLASLGLDLGDASPQLLSVFDEIGQNERLIEELADEISRLSAEDAELARRTADLIEGLREENRELQALAATLSEVGKVAGEFDLEASVFKGLSPEQASQIREALQGIQVELQAVEAARVQVRIAELTGDEEELEKATRRLEAAQKRLNRTLGAVAQQIQASNLPLETKRQLLELVTSLSEDAADSSQRLAEVLSTFEGLARGVLSVADAMGVLAEQERRALQGAVDLAAGLGRVAQGDLIGGVAQTIGGVVGVISGLFGESPEEKARRQAIQENTRAVQELTSSMRRQEAFTRGLTGDVALGLEGLADFEFTRFGVGQFQSSQEFLGGGTGREHFIELLRRFGLTLDDLEAAAEAANIPIDEFIKTIRTGKGDFELATEQFLGFIEAIREGAIDFSLLEDEFSEKMAVLQDRMRAFPDDFDEAIERGEALVDVFAEFLPEEIAQQLAAFDLSTAEGRRQAIDFLQQLFERRLDPEALGGLTPAEFRGGVADLIEAIGEISDEDVAAADGDIATVVRRTITEVTANRIAALLTTLTILEGQQVQLLRLILEALGGTAPPETEIPTTALVGIEALTPGRVIELDERRNELLVQIRDRITPPGPVEETELTPPPNGPETQPRPPSVEFNGDVNLSITTDGDAVEDFYRDVERDGGERLVQTLIRPVDRELGRRSRRR